jgi:hypothetical protein
LKPNGLWVNVGPLLWHFDDGHLGQGQGQAQGHGQGKEDTDAGIGEPGNVELTEEEVLALVRRMGFEVEARAGDRFCGYIQDGDSMLQNLYRPGHWVARKVEMESGLK